MFDFPSPQLPPQLESKDVLLQIRDTVVVRDELAVIFFERIRISLPARFKDKTMRVERPISASQKIPSLDGLRTASLALVLLGHLTGTTYYPTNTVTRFFGSFAHLGVQIFFVIGNPTRPFNRPVAPVQSACALFRYYEIKESWSTGCSNGNGRAAWM